MASGPTRIGRLGDFSRPPTAMHGEEKRTSQGHGLGQNFNSGASGWTGGIWGSSALGGGFANGTNEAPRSTEEASFSESDGGPNLDAKNGRLTASAEADAWGNRQTTPWNTGDAASPALSNAHIHEVGPSSMTLRNKSLPTVSQQTSNEPTFIPGFQAPIGQAGVSGSRSPQKHFLDPTSSTFTAARLAPTGRPFPNALAGDNSQRPLQGPPSTYGDGHGSVDLGRGPAHSQTFGGSGIPVQSKDAAFPLGGYLNSRTEAPMAFQPNPSLTDPPGSHRPSHSSHASSFSSQSTSRRQEESTRDSQQAEMVASLQRMNVHDGPGPNPYASISDGSLNGVSAPFSGPAQPFQHRQPQSNMPPRAWAPDEGNIPNPLVAMGPEGLPEGAFADQLNAFRLPRFIDQRSMSPATQDPRRRFQGQYYPTGATPPSVPDQYRAPSGGEALGRPQANAHSAVLDRKLRGLQQEQQSYGHPQVNPLMMRPDSFRGPFNPHPYDFNQQSGYGVSNMLPYVPIPGLPPSAAAPRGPARDSDTNHNLRSPLLEEFRSSTKTSKRYELKDIFNHVVEFSGDQHGSRFIQQKLETANSDEKEQVFRELKPNCLQLMADVFGNYVIQKFFEHGTQQQKTVLADQMKGHILNLSLQMYGCRVVQKALEHVLVDQQAALVKELDAQVLKCVKDQNGNHVIQKAIERVPPEHIQSIINAFTGQVHSLATHPYGCRVIQRMLEYGDGSAQAAVLQELHACTSSLISDQYGNYVTQHVIEHGKDEDRAKIIKLITAQLVYFSKHKFASNVVEKSIQFGSDEQRRGMMAILTELSSNGSSPVQGLMRDQYGNYVVQKLLGQMKGADFDKLVEYIKPQLVALKKYAYGKQISAIEKIVYTASPSTGAAPTDSSAAPTPPLSATEAQSPQSSSLPSTNNSTVEGPVKSEPSSKEEAGDERKVSIAAAPT